MLMFVQGLPLTLALVAFDVVNHRRRPCRYYRAFTLILTITVMVTLTIVLALRFRPRRRPYIFHPHPLIPPPFLNLAAAVALALSPSRPVRHLAISSSRHLAISAFPSPSLFDVAIFTVHHLVLSTSALANPRTQP